MNNVDLTNNKIFSGGNKNRLSKLNMFREVYNISQKSIVQDFPYKVDEFFEISTGMFTGASNTPFKKQEIREVILGQRCERCGKNINALNSIYGLCTECDDRTGTEQADYDARSQLGLHEERLKRENKFHKTNEEANVYIHLFVNSL